MKCLWVQFMFHLYILRHHQASIITLWCSSLLPPNPEPCQRRRRTFTPSSLVTKVEGSAYIQGSTFILTPITSALWYSALFIGGKPDDITVLIATVNSGELGEFTDGFWLDHLVVRKQLPHDQDRKESLFFMLKMLYFCFQVSLLLGWGLQWFS